MTEEPQFIKDMIDAPEKVSNQYKEDYYFLRLRLEKKADETEEQTKMRNQNRKSQTTLNRVTILILGGMMCLTLRDTDIIYFYNSERGIWIENADPFISSVCYWLCPEFTKHQIVEIKDKIKRRTYFDRENLNPSHLIGLENGALNLETWEIIPHDFRHYLTKNIPVTHDPTKFPYHFEKFFEEVVQEKDRQLLLEVMAHCLMSDYRFQKAFVILGDGNNGKTTFLNVLITLLGEENICSLTLENFQSNQFAASKLFGKMANIADDISAKGLKETQTFKLLTGNGYGDYNIKGKQSITFRNTAKLIFTCNKLPPIYEDTHAIWRRLCQIDFNVTIPEENQIKDLDLKLTVSEELSGILNILLFALRRLLDRGQFEGLKSVIDTKATWVKKSDLIHAFCDNCVEYEEYHWVSTEELFREMCFYAEAINQEPRTKRSLSDRILMYRPKAYSSKGVIDGKQARGFKGINITDWKERMENEFQDA